MIKNTDQLKFIKTNILAIILFTYTQAFAAEGYVLHTGSLTPNGAILFAGDGTIKDGASKRDCAIAYRISQDKSGNSNQFTQFLKIIGGKEYSCNIEKAPDSIIVNAQIEEQVNLIINIQPDNKCTWFFKVSDKKTFSEKISESSNCGDFGKVEY